MAKFQKWLGRRFELDITQLENLAPAAEEGRRLFSSRKASCVACHVNAGASDNQGRVKLFPVPFLALDGSPDPDFNGGTVGAPRDEPLQIIGANKASRNGVAFFEPELDALVSAQISKPGSDLSDFSPFVPFDEGDGQSRSGGEEGFNVQSIIEATRKTQFFHNNAIQGSIEDAIAHYFTDKFDNSQGGGAIRGAFRGGTLGPAVLAELGGTDAINKMGLFLRALSSVYALADCERYVDEMIFRIDNKLPTDLPLDNCRFALNDAFRMLELVRVSPNPYNGVPNQLALIRNRLTTAITVKNTNTKKGQLLGVRGSLQTVRNSILTTDELPAE
jgi:mono/diheme cytochrome c family protein